MAVKFTKPEINVREKLAELDKPSGIAGEAMLRAETPQEQFNLIGAGRRNLAINGGFRVSQRGDYTSATAVNNNQYYLDRFRCDRDSVTSTVQQVVDGFRKGINSVKLTATSSSSSGTFGQVYKVNFTEFPELFSGPVTFSAWVKTNHPETRLYVYSSGQKVPVKHSGNGQWEKLVTTYDLSDVTSADFNVFPYDGALQNITSGDYIEISQFQIELGKVATPFEHRSYGEELALCQRYFQNVYNGQCFGSANTTTRMRINAPLSPEMRTDPTVARVAGTISFQGMGVSISSTSTAVAQASDSGTRYLGMDLGGFSGLTARSYAGSQSRTLVFTADAEL